MTRLSFALCVRCAVCASLHCSLRHTAPNPPLTAARCHCASHRVQPATRLPHHCARTPDRIALTHASVANLVLYYWRHVCHSRTAAQWRRQPISFPPLRCSHCSLDCYTHCNCTAAQVGAHAHALYVARCMLTVACCMLCVATRLGAAPVGTHSLFTHRIQNGRE